MKTSGQDGFTLIEVAVALAILAMAASALMSVFGGAPIRQARIENERLATLGARSLLARIGADLPLAAGHSEGTGDGIRWTLDIDPYGPQPATPPPLALLRISLRAEAGLDKTQGSASIVTVRGQVP